MSAQEQKLQQLDELQASDLRMGLEAIDLDRNIYRQDEGNANLSGILLASLAIPVVIFLAWMLQSSGH